MIVHASDDDGATWSELAVLHAGPAAYSSMAVQSDDRVACLYECGITHPYETITFTVFSLD